MPSSTTEMVGNNREEVQEIMFSLTEVNSKLNIPERKAGKTILPVMPPSRTQNNRVSTWSSFSLELVRLPHEEFSVLLFLFFSCQHPEIWVKEEDGVCVGGCLDIWHVNLDLISRFGPGSSLRRGPWCPPGLRSYFFLEHQLSVFHQGRRGVLSTVRRGRSDWRSTCS